MYYVKRLKIYLVVLKLQQQSSTSSSHVENLYQLVGQEVNSSNAASVRKVSGLDENTMASCDWNDEHNIDNIFIVLKHMNK